VRLELTRRGDYGVRVMLALADQAAAWTSARSIADAMAIPPRFVPHVMQDLVRAGLVETRIGRSGGYRLARPPARIGLLEVIEAIEGDSRRVTCVLRGVPCGRDGHCQVHEAFFEAQSALLVRLRGTTLADLSRPRRPAGRAAAPVPGDSGRMAH
jgi:Rrf2 family protein